MPVILLLLFSSLKIQVQKRLSLVRDDTKEEEETCRCHHDMAWWISWWWLWTDWWCGTFPILDSCSCNVALMMIQSNNDYYISSLSHEPFCHIQSVLQSDGLSREYSFILAMIWLMGIRWTVWESAAPEKRGKWKFIRPRDLEFYKWFNCLLKYEKKKESNASLRTWWPDASNAHFQDTKGSSSRKSGQQNSSWGNYEIHSHPTLMMMMTMTIVIFCCIRFISSAHFDVVFFFAPAGNLPLSISQVILLIPPFRFIWCVKNKETIEQTTCCHEREEERRQETNTNRKLVRSPKPSATLEDDGNDRMASKASSGWYYEQSVVIVMMSQSSVTIRFGCSPFFESAFSHKAGSSVNSRSSQSFSSLQEIKLISLFIMMI